MTQQERIISPPKRESAHTHWRRSDLRGLARLAAQATEGVVRITEGVHQSVWSTLGLQGRQVGDEPPRAGGLTGLLYRSVSGLSRGIGWGVEQSLARIESLLEARTDAAERVESTQRAAWLAALNGVMGDRLEADHNPLAIHMSLRLDNVALDLQQPLKIAAPCSRVLLMIHGLCMNDLQWCSQQDGHAHDHGRSVAEALGYSAIYLRYNSGRHVSHNGAELADLLEQLMQHWPVPIDELSVLAHSMGGLVIRSAIQQAGERGLGWLAHLKHVVFLGTPHHGAPLERAGHGVDRILASSRWSAPFVRLARLRSAGIIDLRHGNVLDRDWQNGPASARVGDTRIPLPLPPGIHFHAIAATTATRRGTLADRLIGDGLVPLDSALGRHRKARFCLAFADDSTWISYRTGHLALLSRPAVTDRILGWLGN
ncbi:MAG: alpha/beta hydrolase [Ideonella sp.]